MASVRIHPSSYHTYPGGDQINLATACFSIYSVISRRTIAFLSSNITSASIFANSVFPTPVGPKNIKEPMGLLGSLSQVLALRIHFATEETAFS